MLMMSMFLLVCIDDDDDEACCTCVDMFYHVKAVCRPDYRVHNADGGCWQSPDIEEWKMTVVYMVYRILSSLPMLVVAWT